MKAGSHHSVKALLKMSLAHRGYKHSPEAREKIRLANLGKKRAPATRQKMHHVMLQRWADPVGRSQLLSKKACPEYREKVRRGRLGIRVSPETRERNRQSRLRHHFPSKMTSIERLLYNEFKKRRLHFEMHKTMFGRFQPDFIFENARLIVQADGDYWHSTAKARKQDAAFAEFAAAEGWSVWRFGEREIHMHAVTCARAVARFVRDHQ